MLSTLLNTNMCLLTLIKFATLAAGIECTLGTQMGDTGVGVQQQRTRQTRIGRREGGGVETPTTSIQQAGQGPASSLHGHVQTGRSDPQEGV